MLTPSFPAGTRETLVFLATAGIVVPIFHRLRISPVLGFIGAGVVLGPFGLGHLFAPYPALASYTLHDVDRFAGVAAFGVVFLLFMIGLELSFERLTAMRRLVFGLGPLQVLGSGVVLGAIAIGFGVAPPVALLLGGALGLSSTAIVVPVLAARRRLASGAGRAAFAVLLFQDLAVAPLLFGVTLLSSRERGGLGVSVLLTLAPAVLGLVAIVVLGRLVLRPLFHHVAAARSTELFVAACLFVVIATGAVAAASGLSMGLGAFLAGLLLAETEYRREIEVTIAPFQGLLLGLFFVAVGAGLDLSRLAAEPGRVLALALGMMAVKAMLLLAAALLARLPLRVAAEVALLLAPGGEFAFVVVTGLVEAGLLKHGLGQNVAVAVALSMVATPAIVPVAEAIGRRLRRQAPAISAEPPPQDEEARVILVGYGRVGQLVGEMLTVHKLPYLVIDDDPSLVARERAKGVPIYFGDATRPEFLRRCGLSRARALVVTINNFRVVERIVRLGRAEHQTLTIVARARDAAHAQSLYDLGATDAVPETIEASLQLSEAVLVDVGVPLGFVIASIHEKRDEFRRLLNAGSPDRRARHAVRARRSTEAKARPS